MRRELGPHLRRLAPSAVTTLGLIVSLVGVATLYLPALVAGTALDAVDGALARRLGVASETGADLDWHTDVAIAHVLTWRVLAPLTAAGVSCALVVWQTLGRRYVARSSGRAWIVAAVCAARVLG